MRPSPHHPTEPLDATPPLGGEPSSWTGWNTPSSQNGMEGGGKTAETRATSMVTTAGPQAPTTQTAAAEGDSAAADYHQEWGEGTPAEATAEDATYYHHSQQPTHESWNWGDYGSKETTAAAERYQQRSRESPYERWQREYNERQRAEQQARQPTPAATTATAQQQEHTTEFGELGDGRPLRGQRAESQHTAETTQGTWYNHVRDHRQIGPRAWQRGEQPWPAPSPAPHHETDRTDLMQRGSPSRATSSTDPPAFPGELKQALLTQLQLLRDTAVTIEGGDVLTTMVDVAAQLVHTSSHVSGAGTRKRGRKRPFTEPNALAEIATYANRAGGRHSAEVDEIQEAVRRLQHCQHLLGSARDQSMRGNTAWNTPRFLGEILDLVQPGAILADKREEAFMTDDEGEDPTVHPADALALAEGAQEAAARTRQESSAALLLHDAAQDFRAVIGGGAAASRAPLRCAGLLATVPIRRGDRRAQRHPNSENEQAGDLHRPLRQQAERQGEAEEAEGKPPQRGETDTTTTCKWRGLAGATASQAEAVLGSLDLNDVGEAPLPPGTVATLASQATTVPWLPAPAMAAAGEPADTVPEEGGDRESPTTDSEGSHLVSLGSVAALSLVVLIVSAIGMTRCTCDCCTCLTLCSCMRRANRSDSDLYFCALSELQKRGATFDVLPDGSSRLHVPPVQEYVLCSTMFARERCLLSEGNVQGQEKYQYLAPATVAFLWQFPPSFVYSDELYQRFERLVEFLSQEGSGIAKARHIVDFRDGSWYRQDVYDFLRQKRWCLAWLHLNNATGWASNLPSGWTDRVQTTNFCFCRLFGPDGQTHGTYDNKFLHELFDSCPRGTTTYVLFGNKEVVARRNVGHRNSIEPPHRSFETFPSCAAMASSGFESGNDDAVEALLFSVTVEERLGWTASAAGVHEDLPDGASEETVTQLLEGLTVGSRISFRGLGKEDRALVHSLAHRLPGLSKSSRADPDAEGQRMVCVERVAPSTAAAPAAAAKPEPDADPVLPRRSRWRRAAGVVTEGTAPAQLSDDALRATAGYPHLEERKPTPSAVPVPTPSRPASLNSAVCKVKSLCIVWLRDDMRLEDNPALFYAAQGGFDAVLPLFILEPDTCHPLRGAGRFWKHQSLRIFTSTLHRLGSCLVLRRGNAVEEIPRLLLELGLLRDLRSTATVRVQLSFNRRGEPWHQSSDQEVASRLRAYGIEVESYPGNVLYEPQDLQPIERWQRWRARVRAEEAAARGLPADSAAASGKPKQLEHISGFGSYRFFSHALEELGPPPFPLGTVDRLPRCPGVASEDLDSLGLGETSGQGFTPDFRQSASHKSGDWAAGIRSWWKVGEAAANERLAHFLDSVLAAGDFEGRKRLLCHERNTSELSPYIRFGEISARKVYWAAKRRRERTNQKLFENPGYEYVGRHASYQGSRDEATKANATFLRRFIWRDLSYWFLWQFPSLPRTSLRPQYEEQTWSGTRRQLRHWQRGPARS
ncbi:Cryptochrome-2 [Symbiodinium microadriaticum]|uniref:Cryptochrome-2 n=1 Tax=Symbiodinium microadriaticum TaxID=2951 RepID=A0A1Q9DT14_SYMMI|nr:Cryptochrome-2 [Symbiodinium microadriaticum]